MVGPHILQKKFLCKKNALGSTKSLLDADFTFEKSAFLVTTLASIIHIINITFHHFDSFPKNLLL